MSSKGNDFSCLYKIFFHIFDETLKGIFVNPFSCEECELCFFFLDTSDHPNKLYFTRKQYEKIQTEPITSGIADVKQSIHNVLKQRYPNCASYQIKESKTIPSDEKNTKWKEEKFQFTWVLFSKCIDDNYGTLFLSCILEQLALRFKSILEDFSNNQKDQLDKYSTLSSIHGILQAATSKLCRYLENLFFPFSISQIISLSGEYYEKTECQSNLLFYPHLEEDKLSAIEWIYQFDDKDSEEFLFTPSANRLVRKLLQIAQSDLCLALIEDKDRKLYRILGICKEPKSSPEHASLLPYVKVKIKRHMHWELYFSTVYIFTYQNGHYKIDRSLDEFYLKTKISHYFPTEPCQYSFLIQTIMQSIHQSHGTMLVVMNKHDVEKEAKRLGNLNYGLLGNQSCVQTKHINDLNAIDGCVFLDLNGNVYGIGMILDGTVPGKKDVKNGDMKKEEPAKGTMAKGARHNSAIKYCNYLKERNIKGMIFIISEDGYVTIISS